MYQRTVNNFVRPKGTVESYLNKSKNASVRKAITLPDDSNFDPTWLEFNIRRVGSHIYFYEEINEVTQLILEVYLKDAVRDVLTEHVGEILGGELTESVTIHLNSPGGYLHCGLPLYDYIKTSQIPITCIVEGMCESAASLIMLACHVRVMSPNSVFLIHQCSWGAFGNNRYMQDNAKNAEDSMNRLINIYLKETKLYSDKNDDDRKACIRALLEHDLELGAEDCEAWGITTPDEDNEDVELSEERLERLQKCMDKLVAEQKKDDAKASAKEEKKDDKKKEKKSSDSKKSLKKKGVLKKSPEKK